MTTYLEVVGRSNWRAILRNSAKSLAERVEATCEQACHRPLAEMIREMVEAYVDVKIEHADISVALYDVVQRVGGPH